MSRLFELLKKEDGVTLAEFLIYCLLLVVIISGAYTIYEGSETIYTSASSQTDAQRSGRISHASITKHLRMIESFEEAGDYSIDIRVDIDDDSLWDTVRYYLDGDCLYKKVNDEVPQKIAYGIRNQSLGQPLFVYYDNEGIAMTTDIASRITKTYQMEVKLVIDVDETRPPGAYTLSSKVTLRNN